MMRFKDIILSLLPRKVYIFLSKKKNYYVQSLVAREWKDMIEAELKHEEKEMEIRAKKIFPDENIIWQFWAQGWNYDTLPEVVQLCYDSMEKYKGNYKVIRLDLESMREYLEFPDFILERLEKKEITYSHFSDVLRLGLLYCYGGVWLDATVFLTGNPNMWQPKVREKGYFLFQRLPFKRETKAWEEFDFSYFSWEFKNKVRFLSSIIYSKSKQKTIGILLRLLLAFWKRQAKVRHYYFFQILYTELMEQYLQEDRCEVVDDTIPHELMKELFLPYSSTVLSEITEHTAVHKLNYKVSDSLLRKAGTMYEYIKQYYG